MEIIPEAKKKIYRSLIQVLNEYEVKKITVKLICENANISKSTFYIYYSKLDDLYIEFIKTFSEELDNRMKELHDNFDKKYAKDYMVVCMKSVQKQPGILNLIRDKYYLFFEVPYFVLLHTLFKDDVTAHINDSTPYSDYLRTFYERGSLEIIKKWFESGCKDEPETIVNIIYGLLPD